MNDSFMQSLKSFRAAGEAEINKRAFFNCLMRKLSNLPVATIQTLFPF